MLVIKRNIESRQFTYEREGGDLSPFRLLAHLILVGSYGYPEEQVLHVPTTAITTIHSQTAKKTLSVRLRIKTETTCNLASGRSSSGSSPSHLQPEHSVAVIAFRS